MSERSCVPRETRERVDPSASLRRTNRPIRFVLLYSDGRLAMMLHSHGGVTARTRYCTHPLLHLRPSPKASGYRLLHQRPHLSGLVANCVPDLSCGETKPLPEFRQFWLRHRPEKHNWLNARLPYARLPNSRLVVLGGTPMREALQVLAPKGRAKRLPIRQKFYYCESY